MTFSIDNPEGVATTPSENFGKNPQENKGKADFEKKNDFTIFVYSHVHPSSKQEPMQTKQFLIIRRA